MSGNGHVRGILGDAMRVLGRRNARILAYHSVALSPADQWTVSPADLELHIRTLRSRGFVICDLGDVVDRLSTGRDVSGRICLTFDDAFADFRRCALPVLKAYAAPATVFVPVGRIGGRSDWAERGAERAIMTWRDLEAVRDAGVEVGSHGVSHSHLPAVSALALKTEVKGSREVLQQWLGVEVRFFAYPYGENAAREQAAVMEAGYQAAVNFGGLWGNRPCRDLWNLTREPMLGRQRVRDLVAIVEGWRDWWQLWLSTRRRILSGSTR